MAGLDVSNKDGNFNITFKVNGERRKFSTHTKNREMAELVKQKVNDLEAAYVCGLSLEESGQLEWLKRLNGNNPRAYNLLVESFNLEGIDETQNQERQESETFQIAKTQPKNEILECNNHKYSHVLKGKDRFVYTETATRINIVIFLTQKTARLHGIDTNSRSTVEGTSIKMSNASRACQWSFENRSYYKLNIMSPNPPKLESKWEMYDVIFTDEGTISPGRLLARYVKPEKDLE